MKKLICLVLALLMVLSLGAAAFASGEASAEASGEAGAEASGEAGAEASGEASAEASGEASAEASGEASAEASGEATAEALPEDRCCEHTYDYLLQPDSYEATDTEGGYRHYVCSVCGAEYAYATDPLIYAVNPKTGEPASNDGAVNPNLPLWERVPDAEPHVFWSKADHEWRVYIYGSHDTGPQICGLDQVAWSAPVYDLSDWRFDGQIVDVYEKDVAPDAKINALFAPDTDYDLMTDTYYMMTFEVFDAEVLRRCVSPSGRFDEEDSVVYSFCADTGWGPYVTTDPAIYIEDGVIYVIASGARMDLADPDYVASLTSAEGLQDVLDTMTAAGEVSNQFVVICQMKADPSQGVEKLHYCSVDGKGYLPIMEGVSLRYDDVSGYYILVYYGNALGDDTSDGRTEGLAYVYTDDLMNGEWIMGDNTLGDNVIYDNNGVYLKDPETGLVEKTDQHTHAGGNNHGGMVKANGVWYICGHVQGGMSGRMNTFEKIELIYNDDGSLTIPAVEMTSSGLADSLDAYGTWEAGIACYIVPKLGKSYPGMFMASDESAGTAPQMAGYDENTVSSHGYAGAYDMTLTHVNPMTNIADGNILGYKYVDFGEDAASVALNLLVAQKEGYSDGSVDVYLDAPSADGGTKLGSVEITAAAIAASADTETGSDGSSWTWISGEMDADVSGVHGVYLVFAADEAGASVCDMDQFGFSK